MAINFDNLAPWKDIKRCILNDDRTVNYYLHPDNSLLKADGSPAKLDGTDGQFMVEIPAFWYKIVIIKKKRYTYISGIPRRGFKLHPWFVDDVTGNIVLKRYFSACEGSIYDVSAGVYLLEDEQVADFNVDKLCSIINAKPASGLTQNLTLPNCRKLANNRGSAWQQQYNNAVSAIQMLMSVELGNYDIQNKLSQGVGNITDDSAANMAIKTGYTVSLGNKSGEVPVIHYKTGQTTKAFSYRGIENFYLNIWKWVDGINIKDTYAYLTIKNSGFISDKFDGNYVKTDIILPTTNGYVTDFAYSPIYDYVFLPAIVGANKVGDYYYQYNGVMGQYVARLGGDWNDGGGGGAFYVVVSSSATGRDRRIGARLICVIF